jgi:hypothetical protein
LQKQTNYVMLKRVQQPLHALTKLNFFTNTAFDLPPHKQFISKVHTFLKLVKYVCKIFYNAKPKICGSGNVLCLT